ncbi:MAG: M14 family zinc carboxypeptidase [Candidatus Brachytrichaceae bacterium NZ_4S206]
MRRSLPLALGLLLAPAISSLAAQARPLPSPATRAERTNYTETSHHADVLAFLDTLVARRAPLVVTELGRTNEGRVLPLVIASKPVVRTPADARALGRPIVYVQANIHAGEVEGKEAVQALLRDLSFASGPTVLDSLVLLVVPIYNADGNERFAAQAQQRGAQNGPELVGQRPNAQGLDLNRDYIKVEAPETRASLAAFAAWEPDVFMDLHTTNGSYHGYHLTYSPSLHPAAPLAPFTGDTMLVTVRERMQQRHGFRIYPYGNFTGERGRASLTDTLKQAWVTYEHKPRFGTNYYGLRGPISILSEAFSHDPFAVRVASTRAFVQEVLSYVAERPREILARVAAGRAASTFGASGPSPAVAVRSRFWSRPDTQAVLVEVLAPLADSSVRDEPGMPLGLRRTGRFASVRMPVVDRFEAALTRTPPAVGWVIAPAVADSVLPRLRAHGVAAARVQVDMTTEVERFVVDSIGKAPRPFQGHQEVTLAGRWVRSRETVPAGHWVVTTGTPRDRLAMLLLEPESDDGLLTWNLMDAALTVGRPAPVWRVLAQPR